VSAVDGIGRRARGVDSNMNDERTIGVEFQSRMILRSGRLEPMVGHDPYAGTASLASHVTGSVSSLRVTQGPIPEIEGAWISYQLFVNDEATSLSCVVPLGGQSRMGHVGRSLSISEETCTREYGPDGEAATTSVSSRAKSWFAESAPDRVAPIRLDDRIEIRYAVHLPGDLEAVSLEEMRPSWIPPPPGGDRIDSVDQIGRVVMYASVTLSPSIEMENP